MQHSLAYPSYNRIYKLNNLLINPAEALIAMTKHFWLLQRKQASFPKLFSLSCFRIFFSLFLQLNLFYTDLLIRQNGRLTQPTPSSNCCHTILNSNLVFNFFYFYGSKFSALHFIQLQSGSRFCPSSYFFLLSLFILFSWA